MQPDAAFTPAQRRAAQAAAAVERENVRASERERMYDAGQDNISCLHDIRMTVGEVIDNEQDGFPSPIGGDRKVSLQQAIDRGAVTVSKGLPSAVVWRRENPELAKTHSPIYWPRRSMKSSISMWPAPSHEALTDSITAMRETQRRLMIGGVLRVGAP